jgi:hypothetical protein
MQATAHSAEARNRVHLLAPGILRLLVGCELVGCERIPQSTLVSAAWRGVRVSWRRPWPDLEPTSLRWHFRRTTGRGAQESKAEGAWVTKVATDGAFDGNARQSVSRSSVVEHSLGKGEVVCSIHTGSTRFPKHNQWLAVSTLPCPPRFDREQATNVPRKLGDSWGIPFSACAASVR